jgi:hypothetical protein
MEPVRLLAHRARAAGGGRGAGGGLGRGAGGGLGGRLRGSAGGRLGGGGGAELALEGGRGDVVGADLVGAIHGLDEGRVLEGGFQWRAGQDSMLHF